jgi:hypothetical protein
MTHRPGPAPLPGGWRPGGRSDRPGRGPAAGATMPRARHGPGSAIPGIDPSFRAAVPSPSGAQIGRSSGERASGGNSSLYSVATPQAKSARFVGIGAPGPTGRRGDQKSVASPLGGRSRHGMSSVRRAFALATALGRRSSSSLRCARESRTSSDDRRVVGRSILDHDGSARMGRTVPVFRHEGDRRGPRSPSPAPAQEPNRW